MAVRVVPFVDDEHGEDAVAALLRVRQAGGRYPPPQDADPSFDSLRAWLLGEDVLARWAAVDGRRLLGHVQVTTAHDYLVDYVLSHLPNLGPVVEIGKLFVVPDGRHKGAATALLNQTFRFAAQIGVRPALAVLPDSVDAISLYRKQGMHVAGSFVGVHGENLVMVASK